MKTLVRFCLGCSIAFETIVTLCIFFGIVPGMLVARLTPWAVPFAILTAGTIVTFVLVGKFWERMGRAEKLLALVPAIAPLGAFRFMFIVIAGFIVASLILAVVGAILSTGGGIGSLFGISHGRASSGSSIPPFGSWWGDDRVRVGGDGRPTWIGDAKVMYGSDGKPVLIGDRKVLYGGDGRIAWVGGDRVLYGDDGSVAWIGERRVRP